MRVLRKVDKRRVRRDVITLADVINLLKQVEKKINRRYFYGLYIQSQREKAEELYAMYSKQLVCKHKDTEEIETVNGHTGVHDFDVVCQNCKFVLDSY
jgi:ABC-type oligopeptide transport system ATPase subunit